MAKILLWILFFIHFITMILLVQTGQSVSNGDHIIVWAVLGVLAICESIEKVKAK